MDNVADQIAARQTGDHKPLVIFEDLEKLDPITVWRMFFEHAGALSGVSFPVIFMFPISLYYEPNFQVLDGPFQLQAHAVMEYNGKRWHNVHPLMADFLRRQGILQ